MRIIPLTFGLVMAVALMAGGDVNLCSGETGKASPRVQTIRIEMGHSRLVQLASPLKRVSVADEKIADVLVISPRQLYVNGKKIGSTNIIVWGRSNDVIYRLNVQVTRDITRLKQILTKVLPDEHIEVYELEGGVVLMGRVSSHDGKAQAETIAKNFEKERVSNMLQVGGQKQVMLELRFAEVNIEAFKKSNINLGYWDPSIPGDIFFTFLGGLTGMPEIDYQKPAITFSTKSDVGGWIGKNIDGKHYMAFWEILKQNGLMKILAEPNLVCVSGKKASFLAGGEFPIPVPGRDYATIQFKKYGVQLDFLPRVLSDGRISLEVTPEVSDLDYSSGVYIGGYAIPGLTTRKVSTQLELKDGQGFAIAGLLKRDVIRSVSKFPLLGDIPILGALFRSTKFQRRETDLIIIVTPHIVRPGGVSRELVSENDFIEPDDLDFFLLGKISPSKGAKASKIPGSAFKLEGKFGHEVTY